MLKIAVCGAGSWGSALSIAFSQIAIVTLWSHCKSQISQIEKERTNPGYLDESIKFPANIVLTNDLKAVVTSDLIILALPLNVIREIVTKLIAITDKLPILLLVSKGFEQNSGLLPHQIMEDLCPSLQYASLIGPSFAKEVALGLPTAISLVAKNISLATKLVHELSGVANLRIYAQDDLIGSEVGGAVKNVLAIAVGISDGLQLGYNARAALITRSLSELAKLVIALGGRRETVYGLTGVGDLMLTATSDLSRNRTVGLMLAKNLKIEEIVSSLGHVAEGVLTTKEVYKLAQKLRLNMPIVESVYQIIYQNKNPKTEVDRLLNRALKNEFE